MALCDVIPGTLNLPARCRFFPLGQIVFLGENLPRWELLSSPTASRNVSCGTLRRKVGATAQSLQFQNWNLRQPAHVCLTCVVCCRLIMLTTKTEASSFAFVTYVVDAKTLSSEFQNLQLTEDEGRFQDEKLRSNWTDMGPLIKNLSIQLIFSLLFIQTGKPSLTLLSLSVLKWPKTASPSFSVLDSVASLWPTEATGQFKGLPHRERNSFYLPSTFGYFPR